MEYSFGLAPNVVAPPPVEISFSAMGTWCHVITHGGGPRAAEQVQAHVARLERVWTRFDPDSELCRANESAGHWCDVSPDTRRLAGHALAGWRFSSGAFDPFVAGRMADIGYDRDFAEIDAPAPPSGRWRRAPDRVPVQVDARHERLRITPGFELDSGGIGKGLAADFAAAAALRRGVRSVLVNLGGDVRCAGRTPADGWRIALDDAWRPGTASDWSIRLRAGGVATSSALRRSWRYSDGTEGNHLLDPRTGLPVRARYAAVSVVARHAWVAEVLTKATLLRPPAAVRGLLHRRQAAAVVTHFDGRRERLG